MSRDWIKKLQIAKWLLKISREKDTESLHKLVALSERLHSESPMERSLDGIHWEDDDLKKPDSLPRYYRLKGDN